MPDPAAYHEVARAQVLSDKCWTMPVVSNGLVYCRNTKEAGVPGSARGGKGAELILEGLRLSNLSVLASQRTNDREIQLS